MSKIIKIDWIWNKSLLSFNDKVKFSEYFEEKKKVLEGRYVSLINFAVFEFDDDKYNDDGKLFSVYFIYNATCYEYIKDLLLKFNFLDCQAPVDIKNHLDKLTTIFAEYKFKDYLKEAESEEFED